VAEFNRRCRESVWKYREEWEKLSQRTAYWLDYSTRMSRTPTTTWKACGGRCARCTSARCCSRAQDPAVLPALRHGVVEPRSRAGIRGHRRSRASTSRSICSTRTASHSKRAGGSSCGRRRRGRSFRTRRLPCIRVAVRRVAQEERCRVDHLLAESRVPAVLGADWRIAGMSSPRTAARRWPVCAIVVRSIGCRIPTKAAMRSSWPRISCRLTMAVASCTWRRVRRGRLRGRPAAWPRIRAARHGARRVLGRDPRSWRRVRQESRRAHHRGASRARRAVEGRYATHAYPHCWRCGTPLLYYARGSWFVRTTRCATT
jgi:isoleucyl-tRNA synthetase